VASPPAVPITFVSPHAVLGGAEAVLRTLIERLGAEWVRGIVVLQDGELVAQLRAMGHEVTVLPAPAGAGMALTALRLRRVLRAQRPAVVHANGVKAALVAGLANAGLRSDLVWMKHDTAGDGRLAHAVATGADAIVGVSETVLATFGARQRRRAAVVYNGIPDRPVDRAAGRRLVLGALGCAPDAEVVALAGRLCVGKGQLELLEAAPALRARRPRVHLAIVGGEDPAFPGFGDALRRRAAALGVAGAVTLTGRRTDVGAFLSGCDVVAAPSILDPARGWREGFGLVAVEALQAGTPVVAYASGALPEVLGDAARIVPEGDRAALAGAIATLLERPDERAELARRGQERAAARYRLDDAIDRMAERYRALAHSRG
jgi:glycosyltransferase involved in cell wall biosynthesis